ncbi:diguanylate cyclase [Chloroflexia bacterium SDU3-3]|nr:diguanylate cyclase [Chloroflexia bacterium SDU3-3]
MAIDNTHSALAAATVLTADHQTGLPTLIRLCADLGEQMRQAMTLTLIVCVIDGLPPEVRDAPPPATLGALVRLLSQVASATPGARLYRTAYDSLALLLPGAARADALQIAEQARLSAASLGFTATLAVGCYPEHAADAETLIAVCEAQIHGNAGEHNRVYSAQPMGSLPPATSRLASLLVARLGTLAELGAQLRATEQQAFHDPVTGLPNARSMEQMLARQIERCAHSHTPLGVLLIDGDNLKDYNTRYGYSAGNEWIRSIARTLSANIRPGDFVARWMMGDEFVVLLPDTGREESREIADRLRLAVEDAGTTSAYPGTISIGVVSIDEHTPPDTLLEQARNALIDAKDRGKNQITML